ncbi:hypothetical protein [Aureimonas sp. AU40]|uniref:hypothetical protein n=1 Tax=Aureimonas sp. AU40 TaxID=1637747 RepID=UPI0007856110|nr:hypothetical protein [Aureimonas sp. AU40]
MRSLKIAGLDVALSNYGIVKLTLDLEPLKITVDDMRVIQTERMVSKEVRKNSDDLRRALEIVDGQRDFISDCAVAFAEVPSGSQSATASYALGVATGALASCPVPIIQVQNFEVKLAAVGTKTASKEEMIEWAAEKYPDAPWPKRGKKVIKGQAEHLADAIAAVHAGLKTQQFKQLLAIMRHQTRIAAESFVKAVK